MLKKWLMIGLSMVLLVSLGGVIGCGQSPVEEAPTTTTPSSTTPEVVSTIISDEDIEWLAIVIASEAGSVYDGGQWVRCTDEERAAVGWTVINRLNTGAYGESIKDIVTAQAQYAHNQEPNAEIKELARDLLSGKIKDETGGATHFFSPISMPKEGEPTSGFDTGGGLHAVTDIDSKVYFPSWTETMIYVGNLQQVRQAYFMFYRSVETVQTQVPSPMLEESKQEQSAVPERLGKIMFSTMDGGIHVINPDGSNEIRIDVKGGCYSWLPDGSKISYVGDQEGLCTINPDGTGKTIVCESYPGSSWPCWYRWLSGGKKLILATYAENNSYINGIYTMEYDGSNLEIVTEGEFGYVVASSDGERIVYVSRKQGIDSLFLIHIGGNDEIKLTENNIGSRLTVDAYLALSPDGKRITSYIGGDGILYVMDIEGNDKIALADKAHSPVWSPNGAHIAYIDGVALFVIKQDGTSRTKLAAVRPGEHLTGPPSWSPDGEKIVFCMNGSIYIVNVDGSGLTKLVESAGMYPMAQWSPVP